MVSNGSVDRRASSLYTLGKNKSPLIILKEQKCLMFCSNSSVKHRLTVTSILSTVLLKI